MNINIRVGKKSKLIRTPAFDENLALAVQALGLIDKPGFVKGVILRDGHLVPIRVNLRTHRTQDGNISILISNVEALQRLSDNQKRVIDYEGFVHLPRKSHA